MKIVVPVKRVAILDADFRLTDDGWDVSGDTVSHALNECDAYACQMAVRLRQECGEGEVVIVTIAEESGDEAIRECLAMGADRGLRVWDQSLVVADALAVARALVPVVEREAPNLVLCGARSSDAGFASTGIALAEHLDLARVAVVTDITVSSSSLLVDREVEGGTRQRLRIGTPALLTIQGCGPRPPRPGREAFVEADGRPIEILRLEALGADEQDVDGAVGAWLLGLRRTTGPEAKMPVGDASQLAERVIEIVAGGRDR